MASSPQPSTPREERGKTQVHGFKERKILSGKSLPGPLLLWRRGRRQTLLRD